jgi:hypothetical protein
MELNLIYSKTASGEEAMRERSRIVQRNMRMVLTLIDGKATVADLCAKTGNSHLAEDALRQLEEGGFIKPLAVQNSLMEQSEDLYQEIKSAATEQTSEFSTFGDKYGGVQAPSLLSSTHFPRSQAGERPDLALARDKDRSNDKDGDSAELCTAGMGGGVAARSSERTMPRDRVRLLSRLKSMFTAAAVPEPQLTESIGKIRHGAGGVSSRWPIVVFLPLLGLLVLAGLLFVFFPINRYLPEVEAALAQASGQQAKISDMHVGIYPKPGLFLIGVRLGSETNGKVVHIAELRLLPEISSLLKAKKIARQMDLSGVLLPVEAIAGFFGIFDAMASPTSNLGVRQIFFEKTDFDLRGLSLPGLLGETKLAPDGRFDSLVLHLPDRSLQIEVKPLAGGFDVALDGFAWRPAPDSAFLFDSLSVKGRLEGSVFSIDRMNLRLFDGLVHGLVRLRGGQQARMDGEITFERINTKRLGGALGIGSQFEGEIGGTMKFLAAADSWAAIFANIYSEGEFSIGRGNLGGFDLTEAARRSSSSPMHGGTTRFEQLQGKFRLTPENNLFSNLTLSSGLMQSVGQVTVSKDLQLSGNIEVQMRGSVNQMHIPLLLSGSLRAPLLLLGKP